MDSVASIVRKYVSERRHVRHCLDLGLLNYSSIARRIKKEKRIDTDYRAIVAALRRIPKRKRQDEISDISGLIAGAKMVVRNRIAVYTLNRTVMPDALIDFERDVKKENSLFYAIEGTRTMTVILGEKDSQSFIEQFRRYIIHHKENLCLISLSCPGIDTQPGIVSYITGMLADAGINMEEFMSCHDDTLIVIRSGHLQEAMRLLEF
jgi:hypothetical protein